MTITYPRDLILDGCFTGNCSFDLIYQQSRSLTGGAQPNVADIGPAYFVAEYQTTVNRREDYAAWQAFLSSLRGGLRTFKGRPALWKWPQAYPRGFAALTWATKPNGNLLSIGAQRDTVTINGLPNGFLLKAGDYFSIPVGSRQHLHRVIEGGTAASNQVTLTIEPTIRPNATTAVAVLFEAPYCEMVLTDQPSISRQGTKGGAISFKAQQVLI